MQNQTPSKRSFARDGNPNLNDTSEWSFFSNEGLVLSLSEGSESGRVSCLVSESRWHDFAQQDAYAYIMTSLRRGDRQEFWKSGETTVARELLPIADEFGISRDTALEIGCGVGRLVFPMAQHFDKVVGVDISPEMIRQARMVASRRKVTNIEFYTPADLLSATSGAAGLKRSVEFVYSLLVFQHIEQFHVIEEYLRLVCSWLSPKGVAYLQFDTRKETLLYKVKNAIPDQMLPRHLRRGIRRIRRKPNELEESFNTLGLVIAKNDGKLSEYHRYVLRTNREELPRGNPENSERYHCESMPE
jgi:SAM-dependent methyltransferase